MIEQLTSADASSKVEGNTFRRETPFWKPNVKLNVLLTTLDALPQPLLIILTYSLSKTLTFRGL